MWFTCLQLKSNSSKSAKMSKGAEQNGWFIDMSILGSISRTEERDGVDMT